MERRIFIVLILSALMVVPVGAATWYGKGNYEPDTKRDKTDGWMYLNPPQTSVGEKVYFNGFVSPLIGAAGVGAFTSTSLNLGALRTAILPTDAVPFAMLGVWRDCNKDGYIGSTDAQYIYRAELLLDTSICPKSFTFPTHNDGIWIYEFQPIRWNNASLDPNGKPINAACCDLNAYYDNNAHVWADYGLPESVVHPTCAVTPPAGGLASTGRGLAFADCNTNNAITTTADTAIVGVGGDSTQLGQLSFSDAAPGKQGDSTSTLNKQVWATPLGKSTDSSSASVWDCSNPNTIQHVNVTDPTAGAQLIDAPVIGPQSVHRQTVPGVVIFTPTDAQGRVLGINEAVNTGTNPHPNTGGSVAGTLNQTDQGITCDPNDGGFKHNVYSQVLNGGAATLGDTAECPATTICNKPLPPAFVGRTRPDNLLVSASWPHKYVKQDTQDPTYDLADKQGEVYGSDFRQYWYGSSITNQGPVSISRDSLVSTTRYLTYYGFVSGAAISNYGLQLAKGGATGVYGQELCAGGGAGQTSFNCDPTAWWKNADGTAAIPGGAATPTSRMCWDQVSGCDPAVRVGQLYNLRDIDCFDWDVGPVRDAVYPVTNTGCQTP